MSIPPSLLPFQGSEAIVNAGANLKIIGGPALEKGIWAEEKTGRGNYVQLNWFGKQQCVSHFVAERPMLRRIVFKNPTQIEGLLSQASGAEGREEPDPC